MMFGNSRAAFHPITRVDVVDALHVLAGRVMDVTADDTLRSPSLGFLDQSFLKPADEVHRILDAELRPRRERPVGQPQLAASIVDGCIERDRGDIGLVAEEGQPLGMSDHDIELIAMDHQIPVAVGSRMDHRIEDFHATKMGTEKIAKEFVMIARHIEHPRPLSGLAQDLLHNIVVCLRPVP